MPVNFRRFRNLMSGKSGAMLERPEERLAVFISDMDKQIGELERSVARAVEDEQRLQRQIKSLRAKSLECEKRALAALENDNEGQAKVALEKLETCDAEERKLLETVRSIQGTPLENSEIESANGQMPELDPLLQ